MKKKPTLEQRLIRQMLATMNRLGTDPMARIDSRVWAEVYRRRAIKLGIEVKP